MKKRIISQRISQNRLFLLLVSLLAVNCCFAQQNESAALKVGVRDNDFIQLGVVWPHLNITIEQSLFDQAFGHQQGRFYIGSSLSTNLLIHRAQAFYSREYSGQYFSYGVRIDEQIKLSKLTLSLSVCPYYDSGLDFCLAYQGELDYRVAESCELVVQYGTLPVYRKNNGYFRLGLHLHKGNISVTPLVNFPVGVAESKHAKLLINMGWNIPWSRKQ